MLANSPQVVPSTLVVSSEMEVSAFEEVYHSMKGKKWKSPIRLSSNKSRLYQSHSKGGPLSSRTASQEGAKGSILWRESMISIYALVLAVLGLPSILLALLGQLAVELWVFGDIMIFSEPSKNETLVDGGWMCGRKYGLNSGLEIFLGTGFLWFWTTMIDIIVSYSVNIRSKYRIPFIVSFGFTLWIIAFPLLKFFESAEERFVFGVFVGWLAFQLPTMFRLMWQKGVFNIPCRLYLRMIAFSAVPVIGGIGGCLYMVFSRSFSSEIFTILYVGGAFPFMRFACRETLLRSSALVRTKEKRLKRDGMIMLSMQTFISTPGYVTLFLVENEISFLISVATSLVFDLAVIIVMLKTRFEKVSCCGHGPHIVDSGKRFSFKQFWAWKVAHIELGERLSLINALLIMFSLRDFADMEGAEIAAKFGAASVLELLSNVFKNWYLKRFGIDVGSVSMHRQLRIHVVLLAFSTCIAYNLVQVGLEITCYVEF